MAKPRRKKTKEVPRADHNETRSSPPDKRRKEYGDANPYQTPGEHPAAPPSAPERETPNGGVEREQDR